jgi:hypothetical protein
MSRLIEVRSIHEPIYGHVCLIEPEEFNEEFHCLPENFKEKKKSGAGRPKKAKETESE